MYEFCTFMSTLQPLRIEFAIFVCSIEYRDISDDKDNFPGRRCEGKSKRFFLYIYVNKHMHGEARTFKDLL